MPRLNCLDAFFILFEGIQVIASVTDIVLDVLVCLELRAKEHYSEYYASVAVFCVAQAAYAFMFAARYGRKLNTVTGTLRAFLLALPFAQLVPVFSWLESHHLLGTDKLLKRMGLAPTEGTVVVDGCDVAKTPVSTMEDDLALWSFAVRKFRSNIGFLVEAIVEAIPQAIIQTYVVVIHKDADVLIIVSILLSVFVVASKGYMLAYSIHGPTFVFNAICVVADVCGLFASIVWAFADGSPFSLSSSSPSSLYLVWFAFAVLASLTISLWGFLTAVFSCFDDHLKVIYYKERRWSREVVLSTKKALFDIWTIRMSTWALAIIPASVLLLGLKVHRRIFAYLTRGGPGEITPRLKELNTLLRMAMREADISTIRSNHIYFQAATRANAYSRQALRRYVHELRSSEPAIFVPWGTPSMASTAQPNAASVSNVEETPMDLEAERRKVARENRRLARERDISEFEQRSVIWWFLRGAARRSKEIDIDDASDTDPGDPVLQPSTVDASEGRNRSSSSSEEEEESEKEQLKGGSNKSRKRKRWRRLESCRRDSIKIRIMMMCGILCFGLGVLCLVALAPIVAVVSITGTIVPLYGPFTFLFPTLVPSCPFSDLSGSEALLAVLPIDLDFNNRIARSSSLTNVNNCCNAVDPSVLPKKDNQVCHHAESSGQGVQLADIEHSAKRSDKRVVENSQSCQDDKLERFDDNRNNKGMPLEIILGLVLSGVYAICLISLLTLLRPVRAFQLIHQDIVDFSDNEVMGEDAFYAVGLDVILEEAFVRYREKLGRAKLKDFLETKANTDGAQYILKFLRGGNERF